MAATSGTAQVVAAGNVSVDSVVGSGTVSITHQTTPRLGANSGGDLAVGDVVAAGAVTITADGNLSVDAMQTSGGNITASAGQGLALASASAPAGSITLSAGGAITVLDDEMPALLPSSLTGPDLLSAQSVTLDGASIGSEAQPLAIAVTDAVRVSADGDAFIDLTMLDAAATLTSLTAGGDANLSIGTSAPSLLSVAAATVTGELALLGDSNTRFSIDGTITSGTQGGSRSGTFTVNGAGQVTAANNVSYTQSGNTFTLSANLIATGHNGAVTITGAANQPLQGSGAINIADTSSELSITNNSTYDIVLGDIDLGAPGVLGAVTINGSQYDSGNLNGVTLTRNGSLHSGNVEIASNGNVRVSGEVSDADGAVTIITAAGSITGENSTHEVLARDLLLSASNGSIGSLGTALRVHAGSRFDATARDYLVVSDPSGDLNLGEVRASVVDLSASASIRDAARDAAVDVTALAVALDAGDRIGGHGEELGVAADSVSALAANDIGLANPLGNVTLDRVKSANGDVYISAANDVRFGRPAFPGTTDTVAAEHGNVDVSAGGSIVDIADTSNAKIRAIGITLSAAAGSIGEILDSVEINTAGGVVNANAAGDVRLTETSGDLEVGSIWAGGTAVISAAAAILDGGVSGGGIDTGGGITLSATSIGMSGAALRMDSARNGSGTVKLDGSNGVYVFESAGDLRLASARASNGDVDLSAAGSIVDAEADSATDVDGRTVTLASTAGSIGAAADRIEINATAGFSAVAATGVYAEDTSGDLALDSVRATNGDVVLVAERSVLGNANGYDSHVAGNAITLQAGVAGSVGTSANPMRIDSNGVVDVSAGSDVNLIESSGRLQLSSLQTGGTAANVAVLAGDFDATAVSAPALYLNVTGGSAHIASFAGARLSATVQDEGAALLVDSVAFEGHDRRYLDLRADNIELDNLRYLDRDRSVRIDVRGNDETMADAVRISGAPSRKILFDRISAKSGVVDLKSTKPGRANKYRINQFVNDGGMTFLTETLHVDVAAGTPDPFRLDIGSRGARAKPSTITRPITVTPRS